MCFTATRKQVNYDSSWSDNNWGRFTALLFGVQQDFLSYLGKTSYQSCNSIALRYTYLSQAHWVKASKVSKHRQMISFSFTLSKQIIYQRDFSRTHHYKNKVGNWALWPNFEKQTECPLCDILQWSLITKRAERQSLNQPKLGSLNG